MAGPRWGTRISVLSAVLASTLIIAAAVWLLGDLGPGGARPQAVPSPPRGPAQPLSRFSTIRSVTFYENKPVVEYLADLEAAIPSIHRAGFDAVWMALPWASMEPSPLASPPQYNQAAFAALGKVLATVSANGMRALIGLNYLGRGWAPTDIDPCRWLTDSRMYRAFDDYATEFLRTILPYHQFVYVLVFSETADPCINAFRHADVLAERIHETLGNLPLQVPSTLRDQFTIGFHDNSLITLGWADVSPLPQPLPYQFVSTVAYGLDGDTRAQIEAAIANRVNRFDALFPGVPVILGEIGATFCPPFDQGNQARVLGDVVSYAEARHLGFNIWHWAPVPGEARCTNHAFQGLAITREDGQPRPALVGLERLPGFVPAQGGVGATPTSTASAPAS
jgi:hypothetical protein